MKSDSKNHNNFDREFLIMSQGSNCNDGKCKKIRKGIIHRQHDVDVKLDENAKILTVLILGISVALIILVLSPGGVFLEKSTEFFIAILATSATILSISFGIGQFTISRISDAYSPHIVKIHRDLPMWKASFFALLTTTIISSILVITTLENLDLRKFAIIYDLELFIISLFYFTAYFFMMMKILDPVEFVTVIRKYALNKLEKKSTVEFDNTILSMGDTMLKAVKNDDQRLAQKYVHAMTEISRRVIEEQNNES